MDQLFYIIAGSIDGCANFLPGFNGDAVYVGKTDDHKK